MSRTRLLLATALIAMTSTACVSTETPATSPPGPVPAEPREPPPGAPTPAPAVPTTYTPGPPVQPAAPAPRPGAPARPAPGPLGPLYPEGAVALPCTLRAEIQPTVTRDTLRLAFELSNLGSEPATITVSGTCPGGMVELSGLPASFDPMHRCQAGACVKPTTTATYTIPPHKSVAIGETTLHANGDACNPPLPLGSTFLSATLTGHTQRVDTCTGAAVHVVRDPKTGALRRAGLLDPPVPATPPRPQPKQAPRPKPEPKPQPKPQPPAKREHCPVCAIGCPNGIPKSGIGPDGCPECGCENFEIKLQP